MKNYKFRIAEITLFLAFCVGMAMPAQSQKVDDGFPVANFSVCANAGADGSMFGTTMVNPGKLGDWLSPQGDFSIGIETNGVVTPLSGLDVKSVERSFPFVHNIYGAAPVLPADISVMAFAPMAIDDVEISSLPVLLVELVFSNISSDRDAYVCVTRENEPDKGLRAAFVTNEPHAKATKKGIRIPVRLKKDGSAAVKLAISMLDSKTLAAARYSDAQAVANYAIRSFDNLERSTKLFAEAIPATGDRELDEYVRWYMIPAVALTKCTSDGDIVTMGYCELNQRDSFWTSWLHLALFPSLERRMIEESVSAITPAGKIPTTILPLIEREDDLDINAFFLLRIYRYLKAYPGTDIPQQWWTAMTSAADWLISRDFDGDGIPVQKSVWGDWKDVGGVEGRKYSPYSALLYLAAMRRMSEMAGMQGDKVLADKYGTAAARAEKFINTPAGDGGLWNGEYYVQRWDDGSVNGKLLQDQMVGVFFGAVGTKRANSIADALNSKNLTRYGVCETYPYYPAEFGYEPATYHNGGVWPWLSFMDCWARVRMGRTSEAISLVERVAKADLVDSGDWSPNEHINSLTGENLGFILQGWNSDLFGLVYYGLMRPELDF